MRDVDTRESDALALIERVRARPARFRDTQITMAHGAGGKATQTLVHGLFLPAFGGDALASWATPA
jgi:hydrogenase expression/formation protein HypE